MRTKKNQKSLLHDLPAQRRSAWVWGGVFFGIVALVLALVISYLIHLSDDGLRELSGPEKQVAQKAASAQSATYLNPKIGNFLQRYYVHIDQVYPTPAAEISQYCDARGAKASTNSVDPTYYSVKLTVNELFGGSQQYVYDGCYLMAHEADGHDLSRH